MSRRFLAVLAVSVMALTTTTTVASSKPQSAMQSSATAAATCSERIALTERLIVAADAAIARATDPRLRALLLQARAVLVTRLEALRAECVKPPGPVVKPPPVPGPKLAGPAAR
jgi:hypothetical protein